MTSETIHSEGGGACIVVTPIGDRGRVNVVTKGYTNVNATFDMPSAVHLAEVILDATGRRFEIHDHSFAPADAAGWTGRADKPAPEPAEGKAASSKPASRIDVRGFVHPHRLDPAGVGPSRRFLMAFQAVMGILADGLAGEETCDALETVQDWRLGVLDHLRREADTESIAIAVARRVHEEVSEHVDRLLEVIRDGKAPGDPDDAERLAVEMRAHQSTAAALQMEKAAVANLLTRLDKAEREWRAEEAARRAIQEERDKLATTLRSGNGIVHAVTIERDEARRQRDGYKRRLDAFEHEAMTAGAAHTMQMDTAAVWHAFPRGRWTLKGYRVDSAGRIALDLEPYRE
jgi:hypothetical protein